MHSTGWPMRTSAWPSNNGACRPTSWSGWRLICVPPRGGCANGGGGGREDSSPDRADPRRAGHRRRSRGVPHGALRRAAGGGARGDLGRRCGTRPYRGPAAPPRPGSDRPACGRSHRPAGGTRSGPVAADHDSPRSGTAVRAGRHRGAAAARVADEARSPPRCPASYGVSRSSLAVRDDRRAGVSPMPHSTVKPALTPNRRRRVVENDEFAAFVRRVVGAHGRRVGTGDVEALADLVALSDHIDRAHRRCGLRPTPLRLLLGRDRRPHRRHPPGRATAVGEGRLTMPFINVIRGQEVPNAPLNVRTPIVHIPLWMALSWWTLKGLALLVFWTVRYWYLTVPAGVLLWLYVKFGWAGPVGLLAGLTAGACGWAFAHRASFLRFGFYPALGRWRRWCYRRRWYPAMATAKLAVVFDRRTVVPVLKRVRCRPGADELLVRMVTGQIPDDFAKVAERLAHTFAVRSVKAMPGQRPDVVVLVLLRGDPLLAVVAPLPVPALPDFTALPVAKREDGGIYALRLFGTQVLIVG